MLAFLNLGPMELVVIAVVAVLIFGKDLPQAASKAYSQVRKLRGAVDDLRRESGIERELRNIERSMREAEWEARKIEPVARKTPEVAPRQELPAAGAPAAVPREEPAPRVDVSGPSPEAGPAAE